MTVWAIWRNCKMWQGVDIFQRSTMDYGLDGRRGVLGHLIEVLCLLSAIALACLWHLSLKNGALCENVILLLHNTYNTYNMRQTELRPGLILFYKQGIIWMDMWAYWIHASMLYKAFYSSSDIRNRACSACSTVQCGCYIVIKIVLIRLCILL